MYKSKLLFAACCCIFLNCGLSVATPLPSYFTHTHNTHIDVNLQLKPTYNQDLSFRIAASTFLPEWIEKFSFYSQSDLDFSETSEQNRLFTNCVLKGYNRTSCDAETIPADFCPLSNLYFKTCLSSAKRCADEGFVNICSDGYIKNTTSLCPHNPDYGKCIANPCTGFEYSLSEASAPGYLAGDKCLSGEVDKYKRSEATCPGFGFDTSNCGTGSKCEKLEGLTCLSGTDLKYAECNPCPIPACSLPSVNIDTYYCNGALRCLIP